MPRYHAIPAQTSMMSSIYRFPGLLPSLSPRIYQTTNPTATSSCMQVPACGAYLIILGTVDCNLSCSVYIESHVSRDIRPPSVACCAFPQAFMTPPSRPPARKTVCIKHCLPGCASLNELEPPPARHRGFVRRRHP